MDYKDAINQIKNLKYKRVLVTGPQRSGTTITGKILAKELNFNYIDEMEIKVDKFDLLFSVYQNKKFVLQAPGLSAYAHMMPGCVCFMRRPIEEIIKSQKRINWDKNELTELKKYFRNNGEIAKIKYDFLDTWQKKIKPEIIEIDYDSIKDHYLYVPPELRKNFTDKQTTIDLSTPYNHLLF